MSSASSAIRAKSGKKKAQAAKKQVLKTAIRIAIEDLRVGDRIVTSWHRGSLDNLTEEQRVEMLEMFLDGGEQPRFVASSKEIKQFEECPSQWRTHVHINKTECYDMRGRTWIVNS